MAPGEILPSISEGHGAEGIVKNLPKGSLQMPVFSFLCLEKILVRYHNTKKENVTGIKILPWWVEDKEVTPMSYG